MVPECALGVERLGIGRLGVGNCRVLHSLCSLRATRWCPSARPPHGRWAASAGGSRHDFLIGSGRPVFGKLLQRPARMCQKRKRFMMHAVRLGVVLALLVSATLAASDWPQWRGPNGTGVTGETGLP